MPSYLTNTGLMVSILASLTTSHPATPANPAVLDIRAPNPPAALPEKAPDGDLKWQPVMDFDKDGCYNVPAIDKDGHVSEGLDHDYTTVSGDCRDESDLRNNNVYSRSRCNSGWCVYVYDYYFEKDVATEHVIDTGHRHDWEHVQVWVKDDKAEYVSVSQHGDYETKKASDVRFEGDRAKVVYHKSSISTHALRFGTEKDDGGVENHNGKWFRGALVGWDGFPGDTRDKLSGHDFGKANFALKDDSFKGTLDEGKPDEVDFDTGKDD